MALHGHFTVSGFPVGFQDDGIQIAKTCQTEDLFNLSAAESIPANTTDRRASAFPLSLPSTVTSWPPLFPSSPPASTHRSRGGVHTAGREIGVWKDDYRGFHLFSLASVFSPARRGHGSLVTSGAIATPHYSSPSALPPARSQRALLWKRRGGGAHLDSGKTEPEHRGRGAQRPVGSRNIWCPLHRRRQRGAAFPTVLMFTPSCWDGGPPM